MASKEDVLFAEVRELIGALKQIADMAANRKTSIRMPDGTSLELFARSTIARIDWEQILNSVRKEHSGHEK